ncbi:AMP-binding protein [Xenorhabdus sp. SF857]|nr:AMP-binding protein [Xenorhabdus sp. SF857]WFQ79946.1 AMP-binding protein [Xenorhabdus sp. SF857]
MSVTEWTQWPWQHWAAALPEKQAIQLDDEQLTWHQLTQSINAIAVHFRQQGVVEGSGVILRGKNSAELLLCYLAVLRCGARALLLNPQLPDRLLAELLAHLNMDYGVDFTDSPSPVMPVKLLDWQQKFPAKHDRRAKKQPIGGVGKSTSCQHDPDLWLFWVAQGCGTLHWCSSCQRTRYSFPYGFSAR